MSVACWSVKVSCAEDGHLTGAGAHRLDHLGRRRRQQRRRVVPVGERAADAGRVVARGAVGPEEVAAVDDVRGGDVDGRDRRAGSERGDVGHQRLDLVVAVGRWLAHGLLADHGQRHAARAELEVRGRRADADQRRAPGPTRWRPLRGRTSTPSGRARGRPRPARGCRRRRSCSWSVQLQMSRRRPARPRRRRHPPRRPSAGVDRPARSLIDVRSRPLGHSLAALAHRIRKMVAKRPTHTTSTKCQYQVVAWRRPGTDEGASGSRSPTMARSTRPTVTCRPWNPVERVVHAAVGVRRDAEVVARPLRGLVGEEDDAERERRQRPVAGPPAAAPLGRVEGEARRDEDEGEQPGADRVEVDALGRPVVVGRADGEVRREQPTEEHDLGGQPDGDPHRGGVRPADDRRHGRAHAPTLRRSREGSRTQRPRGAPGGRARRRAVGSSPRARRLRCRAWARWLRSTSP